jgi:hypothetical protein
MSTHLNQPCTILAKLIYSGDKIVVEDRVLYLRNGRQGRRVGSEKKEKRCLPLVDTTTRIRC